MINLIRGLSNIVYSSVDGLYSGGTSYRAFLVPYSMYAYTPRACSYACTVHMYTHASTQREIHYLYNMHASIHKNACIYKHGIYAYIYTETHIDMCIHAHTYWCFVSMKLEKICTSDMKEIHLPSRQHTYII